MNPKENIAPHKKRPIEATKRALEKANIKVPKMAIAKLISISFFTEKRSKSNPAGKNVKMLA